MSAYEVVIPAYNAAKTIAETIQSVLGQTAPPERIIVVDDGSTDATETVVGALGGPIDFVRRQHVGPGAATWAGLEMVSTPLVATVDSDDLWLPSKVEVQRDFLSATGSAAVFCHLAHFRGEPSSADLATAVPGWSRSTLLIRTDVARSVGPIVDGTGLMGEMIDWFARLREVGHRLEMMDDVLALRRVHPGSLSYARTEAGMRGYLETARAALQRKRRTMSEGRDE